MKAAVFIDANQYLDLFQMVSGKKLLEGLLDQQDHIFVTTQVVDEVYRNKLNITARFMAERLKELTLKGTAVPDHLLHTKDDRVARVREHLSLIHDEFQDASDQLNDLTSDLLEQVSRSKDEVSKVLAEVFSKAIKPDETELQHARARRESGNPPGKPSNPLGHQVNWEQILSRYKDQPMLWIITRDSDYATTHQGKLFLNAALYNELALLHRSEPRVFCFDNIAEGLRHFAEYTGVKAGKLPTLEETKEIKKEQESLPPIGWLESDAAQYAHWIQSSNKNPLGMDVCIGQYS
jgi:hypothetical protein